MDVWMTDRWMDEMEEWMDGWVMDGWVDDERVDVVVVLVFALRGNGVGKILLRESIERKHSNENQEDT